LYRCGSRPAGIVERSKLTSFDCARTPVQEIKSNKVARNILFFISVPVGRFSTDYTETIRDICGRKRQQIDALCQPDVN